ncbi:MAG TPA: peptidylprolyl isomerase [Tepidisphaeraceae bacterium]|nr:peptidylprolyl isomerase [Tepidisphaeraceae bacterium]
MQVTKDKVVEIDYTLTDAKGAVIDSSKGRPLAYLHGAAGIIPGLEKELEGKSAGDHLQVTVPPEQGYGIRDESLLIYVPRKAFGKTKIERGMRFELSTGQNAQPVTVVSLQRETVRVDANHALAGQTLHFDVKIVSVRDATPQELSHGHAHGAGGHHH